MKIVIDSESLRFRTVRRWFICLAIWVVVMIISGIITNRTGWDADFFEGYFTCLILRYAYGEIKL